jgi:uncharacterized protein YcnI
MKSRRIVGAALCTALGSSSVAFGHVTFEGAEARADSYYKAVLRVPHGCDGSPTSRIRIQIPDGVIAVKPQPKPGWTLSTTIGKLAQPYKDQDSTITEGVREVSWSGGRLADEHYDEFVMRVKLPNRPGEMLYFPIVQECEKGTHRWIEIPDPGKSVDDYKEPAPGIRLLPKR